MKKLLFIFNPRAGKAQIKGKLLDILDLFVKAEYEVTVHTTQGRGDAARVVRERGMQADLIVCSGGDGTLSETVNGLMTLLDPPVLGYIPAGSTNDFASSLKIPKQMIPAASLAIEGVPIGIDIGRFGQNQYFVYIAGFGAFTEVSYLTSQDKKNLLGHQAYMIEGVKSLTSIKSYRMEIQGDNTFFQGDFIFGMVTNTISVGGFKGLVAQDVALNDGEFEVLFISTPKTPLDLSNIISYMFLKEEKNEYVHKFRTKSLKVTCEEPVDWVLDGEFGGSHIDVEIVNLQDQIQIIRPM